MEKNNTAEEINIGEKSVKRYKFHLFARKIIPLLCIPLYGWLALPFLAAVLYKFKKAFAVLPVIALAGAILTGAGAGMAVNSSGMYNRINETDRRINEMCDDPVLNDACLYKASEKAVGEIRVGYTEYWQVAGEVREYSERLAQEDEDGYDGWKAEYIAFYNSVAANENDLLLRAYTGSIRDFSEYTLEVKVYYDFYRLSLNALAADIKYSDLTSKFDNLYDAVCADLDGITGGISALEEKYSGGVPSAEAMLAEIESEHNKLEKLRKKSDINENTGFSLLTAGMCLFGAVMIAALVCFGCLTRRGEDEKAVLSVVKEVDAGEGVFARKRFVKTLCGYSAKAGEDAFNAELNAAHARYIARESVILTRRQTQEVSRKIVVAGAVLDGKESAKALEKQCRALYAERGFEKLSQIYSEYTSRLEAYKNDITASGAQEYEEEYDGQSTFDGTVWQRIGWTLLGNLVTAVTLGIAYPVAVCWKQRWQCNHTVYNGKRLSFDGTGAQLFGKWICWSLLSAVTLGIYGLFVAKKLERWKAKHTRVAGEFAALGGTFDGGAAAMFGIKILCDILAGATLGLGLPFAACIKERWLCSRRVYDGKRLVFSGDGAQLFGKYIIWWLLSVVTLGVYALTVPNRMLKWKAQRTALSEESEAVL